MAKTYGCYNGAGLTTTGATKVATGSATLKTMIQLLTSASSEARIVEWWWEGDASAAATPAVVELMFHSTGAATVTAYTAATDFKKYDPNSRASLLTVGTAGSGFTASGEGTPATALGVFAHSIPPTSGMYFQYPLGREPEVPASSFVRIRNTVAATTNALCGISWEE
jgi:hypothetical protein